MGITEVMLAIVSAVATLTPLTLGILNYAKDRKSGADKPPASETEPQPTMGMTIDFDGKAINPMDAYVASLIRDIMAKDRQIAVKDEENRVLEEAARTRDGEMSVVRAQRDRCRDMLRAHGIEVPF